MIAISISGLRAGFPVMRSSVEDGNPKPRLTDNVNAPAFPTQATADNSIRVLSLYTAAQFATDKSFGSRSYLDVLATFKVKDNYSFRVGVNNVLDQDPPLTGSFDCPAGACNQNVYAQTYDALGRYIFVGVTADF